MMIYLVLHHEIMGALDDLRADEMLFYTAKSYKKALEMIKTTGVSRWSWWEIQVQELDNPELPEHVGYFGLRGGKLAKPPFEKCVAIFKKEKPNG